MSNLTENEARFRASARDKARKSAAQQVIATRAARKTARRVDCPDSVMNAIRERFSRYVLDRREALHLTRVQVADGVPMDPSMMTLIESGHIPSRGVVMAMAGPLAVPVDELLMLAGYAPVGRLAFRRALAAITGRKPQEVAP